VKEEPLMLDEASTMKALAQFELALKYPNGARG
jgi:hypothetical protein